MKIMYGKSRNSAENRLKGIRVLPGIFVSAVLSCALMPAPAAFAGIEYVSASVQETASPAPEDAAGKEVPAENAGEEAGKVLIQAHAGAAKLAPENTIAAFRAAKAAGADGIETDIRMTKDHKLVIRHDDSIDDTSNGQGRISEMTLSELKGYDFGSWFDEKYAGETILTLEECLEEVKALDFEILNLEMKPVLENNEEFVRLTADTIRAAGMTDCVMVSSFDRLLLKELKEYAPEIPAAMLTIPRLTAISMFRFSDYLPADKPLRDYTLEDVKDVPRPVAALMFGFGARGNSPEEIILGVIEGIAAVTPPDATWNVAEEMIEEEADLVSYVDNLGLPVDYLNCHYNSLTQDLMEEMNQRGIGVNVWTPDTAGQLQKALSFEPDGIITNEVETALSLSP